MSTARKTLKDYMPEAVRSALGDLPTWHSNCMEAANGVARPGKTAKDRARRERRAAE